MSSRDPPLQDTEERRESKTSSVAEVDPSTVLSPSDDSGVEDALTILRKALDVLKADAEFAEKTKGCFADDFRVCELTAKAVAHVEGMEGGFDYGPVHGFSDVFHGDWSDTGGVKLARHTLASGVYVRMRREELGKALPLEILLATFLHELAHCFTPGELYKTDGIDSLADMFRHQLLADNCFDEDSGKQQGGGRMPKWLQGHHTAAFYANFAWVLRVAERLGIYQLPASAGKFTAIKLQRFDNIDIQASADTFALGYSPMFRPQGLQGASSVRVTVCREDKRHKRMVIVIENEATTWDLLQTQCINKLQLKKPKKNQVFVLKRAGGESIEPSAFGPALFTKDELLLATVSKVKKKKKK